jgi:hypothetical protein
MNNMFASVPPAKLAHYPKRRRRLRRPSRSRRHSFNRQLLDDVEVYPYTKQTACTEPIVGPAALRALAPVSLAMLRSF